MGYGFSVSFNFLRKNKYPKDVSAGYFHVSIVLRHVNIFSLLVLLWYQSKKNPKA